MVLHADELGPSVLLRHGLHHTELVGPHGTRAKVADFTAFDEVVQRFHGLFDGCVRVEAVHLQEVDVVCFKASEGCVHGGEDGGS